MVMAMSCGGWSVNGSTASRRGRLTERGERLYGRGVADNKGQHSINLAALAVVLAERGRLGFNSTILLETGEEIGSPGLREFCERNGERLGADLLLASDGPRLRPDRPTLYMGSRGALNFDLNVELREDGHHSGNWGGLLANPGIILAKRHRLDRLADRAGEGARTRAPSHARRRPRRARRLRCRVRRGRPGDRSRLGASPA